MVGDLVLWNAASCIPDTSRVPSSQAHLGAKTCCRLLSCRAAALRPGKWGDTSAICGDALVLWRSRRVFPFPCPSPHHVVVNVSCFRALLPGFVRYKGTGRVCGRVPRWNVGDPPRRNINTAGSGASSAPKIMSVAFLRYMRHGGALWRRHGAGGRHAVASLLRHATSRGNRSAWRYGSANAIFNNINAAAFNNTTGIAGAAPRWARRLWRHSPSGNKQMPRTPHNDGTLGEPAVCACCAALPPRAITLYGRGRGAVAK